MAKGIQETPETQTGGNEKGSLTNFQFSNDDEWFGQKIDDDDSGAKTIQEIKKTGVSTEKTTDIKATSPKSKAGKQDDDLEIEDDDEEDKTTFFGVGEEDKNKTKKKVDKEEEEDENATEVEVAKKDATKVKPEEEKETGTQSKTKEEKEAKEGEEEDDDEFFTTLAAEMKEKGIFQNIEIPEGKKLTEEEFLELQDQEIEARVTETFESFLEEMDDDGKAFLKFKKSGGKTTDFLTHYAATFDLEEFDENDPKQVDKVNRYYLTTVEKLNADDLEDRIAWMKEGGKEKAKATKWFEAIKKAETDKKKTILAAQEKAAELREEKADAFNAQLVKVLNKTEKVGTFVLTEKDKKELTPYMTKATVKVGKNKFVPPLQAELSEILKAETDEAKQKLLILGKLVKNNFDVADLITKVETKVATKAKSALQQAKKGIRPISSGSKEKKELSDFFME
jgi:hypothetical protein